MLKSSIKILPGNFDTAGKKRKSMDCCMHGAAWNDWVSGAAGEVQAATILFRIHSVRFTPPSPSTGDETSTSTGSICMQSNYRSQHAAPAAIKLWQFCQSPKPRRSGATELEDSEPSRSLTRFPAKTPPKNFCSMLFENQKKALE